MSSAIPLVPPGLAKTVATLLIEGAVVAAALPFLVGAYWWVRGRHLSDPRNQRGGSFRVVRRPGFSDPIFTLEAGGEGVPMLQLPGVQRA